MRRRDFLAGIAGSTASWPMVARAQQSERMRRIGVFMSTAEDDPVGQSRLAAFQKAMQQLGWNEGRNVHMDTRWGTNDTDLYRKYAAELVALAPDVILSATGPSTQALQRVSRTVPIVFAIALDPVGSGIVESLARPGGNATGFMQFEYSLSGKWPELLKGIAPGLTRAAVLRDPDTTSGVGQFAVIQAVAPPLRIDVIPIDPRDASDIESAVQAFARSANGGLIVTAGPAITHRDLIFKLAAQHQLPVVYPYRFFVASGGLMSYGTDLNVSYQRAASYVDRILKGEKPADLPVQAPTKYELVINLKTAKSLGLEVPPSFLARVDEVIE
jgi:putative ABC transport system substrate-binding protein